ncbi:hypothetical protein JMJ77_0003241 [Colletotrichum scovillei]|uniref:Uncharacterized protein n=1 Tax=Colletotrichum scovillei TaxID=1209932 RepID=A0A9P7QWR9_9PEZI|nr:hypothetical protein JMJ78_0006454 [Colletotrichum scovillei]KAG7043537.1 hypothetical protein JMJ77_0003241 [Colletotrichum scovillei]KAG7062997.1 hypothetical protein JMJ76_0009838 [Colletotrichum scovillei]
MDLSALASVRTELGTPVQSPVPAEKARNIARAAFLCYTESHPNSAAFASDYFAYQLLQNSFSPRYVSSGLHCARIAPGSFDRQHGALGP